jgi:hypothetical protein
MIDAAGPVRKHIWENEHVPGILRINSREVFYIAVKSYR